ncbi:MAG: hypothetical protein LBT04_02125 [Prevotellaceae bacterium]|jgi:hypothetical protein|nr:hypothetical protein [Prevotellaceae bacterium]
MSKKKFSELKEGELFYLEQFSDKMYRLEAICTKTGAEGEVYYLTRRAYGNGASGFWSTKGDKEVFGK